MIRIYCVIGDSYIDNFIIDDLEESFQKTVMACGEHVQNIEELIDYHHPAIVINENAEMCDRNTYIWKMLPEVLLIKDNAYQ